MARSFCILVVVINFLFSSEEFIFWADIISKNNIIISENLNISKSMVLKNRSDFSYICTIDVKKDDNLTSINFLNLHKNKLLDCFVSQNIIIKDELTKNAFTINKNTKMIINPIHFIIEFKPNSANIYKFKQRG